MKKINKTYFWQDNCLNCGFDKRYEIPFGQSVNDFLEENITEVEKPCEECGVSEWYSLKSICHLG